MVQQTGAAMANTLSEVAKDVSKDEAENQSAEGNFQHCVCIRVLVLLQEQRSVILIMGQI